MEVLEQSSFGVSGRGFIGDVGAGEVDFYAEGVDGGDFELGSGDEAVAFCYVDWGAGNGDYEGFCCLGVL